MKRASVWRRPVVALLGTAAVVAALMFGNFGSRGGPLGTGQQRVSAQPSGTIAPRPVVMTPQMNNARWSDASAALAPPAPMSAARLQALEEKEERIEAALAARVRGLPASDPRVPRTPPPAAELATNIRGAAPAFNGPGPMAPGTLVTFKTKQLAPPNGFSAYINEPAVAQNGKGIFESFNWYVARSVDGGTNWQYFDPENVPTAGFMSDFCCDQDFIYDFARDVTIWERLGIGAFSCGGGCTQNRMLLTITSGDFNTIPCTWDVRGTTLGLNNAFIDYPRMALSDKYVYVQGNIYDFTGGSIGGYITHFLLRLDKDALDSCTTFTGNVFLFSAGWSPTMIENAKEVLYMGDQIITSVGLNNTFRIYWMFDTDSVNPPLLNFVDRTLTDSFQYTNGNASCVVPGGANPCARADHRITGAVLAHNSPSPNGLGAAADKLHFFWNVAQGNGFNYPYVESATFHAGTILQGERRLIYNTGYTFFYAAAGANDRQHIGLSLMVFYPSASHPYSVIGIDDDYNGNPPGWEVATTFGGVQWSGNGAGDYLRARTHAPAGGAFIVSGYSAGANSSSFIPNYVAFGRQRDLNGYNSFAT